MFLESTISLDISYLVPRGPKLGCCILVNLFLTFMVFGIKLNDWHKSYMLNTKWELFISSFEEFEGRKSSSSNFSFVSLMRIRFYRCIYTFHLGTMTRIQLNLSVLGLFRTNTEPIITWVICLRLMAWICNQCLNLSIFIHVIDGLKLNLGYCICFFLL